MNKSNKLKNTSKAKLDLDHALAIWKEINQHARHWEKTVFRKRQALLLRDCIGSRWLWCGRCMVGSRVGIATPKKPGWILALFTETALPSKLRGLQL